MDTLSTDTAATDHLLSTTRAVRKRLDLERPVPREVVLECLRLAVQAPTGSNSQGWRWMVVTDPSVKAKLADLYRKGSADYFKAAEEMNAASGDKQSHRIFDSATYLARNLEKVPALVIPCIKGRPEGDNPAGLYASIIPAAWSFMLALRSRGLGSAWTTLHLTFEKEAAEILGIPYERVTQVGLLPVAYYTGSGFKPASRPPVETITYWNHWKATAGA